MRISRRIFWVGAVLFSTTLAVAAIAAEQHYPWQKSPGPIAGRWAVTCDYSAGMVVDISVEGKSATGRIFTLGKGTLRGYSEGEEIFRLEADDFGDWVGQLRWRGMGNKDRWDPIRFVATPKQLDATMTTDNCFKMMPRAK